MSTAVRVIAGPNGRRVHLAHPSENSRHNVWWTECGMGGVLGEWLKQTGLDADCKPCLRRAERLLVGAPEGTTGDVA